jgi:type II secretory pathway component PulC
MRLKMLMRNVNVLNGVLIAAITLFALYLLSPLLSPQVAFTLPSPKKLLETKEEKSAENPLASPAEYTIIAEKNLLHPERKIPVDKPEAPPLPKPEFVLYGTLIAGDVSLAYLEDQKASTAAQGKGKKQRALKKGETMSGFTLKEIEADKVVMVRGEEKIEVKVSGHARQEKPAQVAGPKTPSTPQQPGRTARPRSSRLRTAPANDE